jgi:hypothetical protein
MTVHCAPLQDPSNGQFILSDAPLLALVGKARFKGFGTRLCLRLHCIACLHTHARALALMRAAVAQA